MKLAFSQRQGAYLLGGLLNEGYYRQVYFELAWPDVERCTQRQYSVSFIATGGVACITESVCVCDHQLSDMGLDLRKVEAHVEDNPHFCIFDAFA